MMVDHTGALVDGDELLYIIATDLQERGRLPGGVVGTLMSNLGLELALKARDIPFVRAKVGDRYVMAEMLERDWVLGGENSGHIVCAQHVTTGDAIIAAAEHLSGHVCEACGAPGSLQSWNRWWSTRCPDHKRRRWS